ncbi:hypothetical protein T07_14321 [Trichinella nelsoni]|uniref:Uncharacterized protein n=1 Tax=Trichinella nelsoni TaxID=6336 RepID=A0A0V0RS98_9BILA|nr:hypothetical protein T07_14321 [Trichinella nelsoni]
MRITMREVRNFAIPIEHSTSIRESNKFSYGCFIAVCLDRITLRESCSSIMQMSFPQNVVLPVAGSFVCLADVAME